MSASRTPWMQDRPLQARLRKTSRTLRCLPRLCWFRMNLRKRKQGGFMKKGKKDTAAVEKEEPKDDDRKRKADD